MPKTSNLRPHADPATLAGWLSVAVSQFEAAGLSYGHGTSNALDEAAFLILRTLGLPIDSLELELDRRLTKAERKKVWDILERRVATRKPAAYLLNEAWIGDYRFYVDQRVIVPRSFIGELLQAGLGAVLPDSCGILSVLDLCTGSGCLAVLAAAAFPEAKIDATDISTDALIVAQRNAGDYRLGDRICLRQSDLFAGLRGKRYDLILSNPPYVSRAELAEFPPEHAAEPAIAHAGGEDGMDLVRKILAKAGRHLNEHGTLIVEIGTGREILERDFPRLPFLWLDSEASSGEVFALSAAELTGQPSKNSVSKKKGMQ